MALRIVASRPDPAIITLPWSVPLEEWGEPHVIPLPRGLSRHVVRIVRLHDRIYAVKETVEEIGEALATLPDRRTPTKADWHRLSRDWRPRLDDQIRRIELLRDRLDSCIGCGCLSLKSCALTNPGDDLADRGPGAVLLDPDRRPW